MRFAFYFLTARVWRWSLEFDDCCHFEAPSLYGIRRNWKFGLRYIGLESWWWQEDRLQQLSIFNFKFFFGQILFEQKIVLENTSREDIHQWPLVSCMKFEQINEVCRNATNFNVWSHLWMFHKWKIVLNSETKISSHAKNSKRVSLGWQCKWLANCLRGWEIPDQFT